MSVEVKVPNLPESVSEATVATWHKKPGDQVARDENVVDLETDKVMLEVPAVSDGVLEKILKEEGETVGSGDVIATLGSAEQGVQNGTDGAAAKNSTDTDEPGEQEGETQQADEAKQTDTASGSEDEQQNTQAEPLSPAVRKLVAENDLDPSEISGSGKGGRLLKSDVQQYLEQRQGKAADKPRSEPKQSQPDTEQADQALPDISQDGRPEERVPMTRIRARIAERLVEVQHSAAILTTFNEVNLQAVSDLRARHKEQFEKDNEVKLGFMSFFVKAAAEALKRFPVVNASIDGNDVIYHGYYDIGIAVSSPRGLVVPILRDADGLGFAEVERQIRGFGRKARDNKLTMDDLQGGTFSITNGGVFGSMLSTPIINPPQSAILGMHGIQQRPVAVDNEIVIRPMMYLALSYDHRLVDGRDSVQFLRTIKELLEDPSRMLLQV